MPISDGVVGIRLNYRRLGLIRLGLAELVGDRIANSLATVESPRSEPPLDVAALTAERFRITIGCWQRTSSD